MKKNRIKTGILAVSMLTGTAAAINGNISEIAKAFPDAPISSVELISTIPSFALIVSVLSSTWIAKKIGMRRAVLAGVFSFL